MKMDRILSGLRAALSLFQRRSSGTLHGWAGEILLLMVVRLVTHGDLLFLDPPPQLAVYVLAAYAVHGPRAALEDTPHMMEQTIDG